MKIRWLPFFLLCLVLAGCSTASDTGGCLILAAEGAEAYGSVLSPFLWGYTLQEAEDQPLCGAGPGKCRRLL